MNRLDLIIDALESAHHTNDTGVMGLTKSRLDVALAAARELKEAHADMLSALRAIVAVAETEKHSFTMNNIKDCANIAIKQATVEQA